MTQRYRLRWLPLATLLLLLAGCSSTPESRSALAAAPGTASAAAPSPSDEAVPATPPSTASGSQPAEPSAPPTTSPVPDEAERPTVIDPGGLVVVAPTRDGLTTVGAAKCKTCHKVQFDSWSASAHARRTPPLECEGCHGPGSEYKTLAIMKDPEKAKAAGLVMPGTEFCARCHQDASGEMLAKAHLHKTGGA